MFTPRPIGFLKTPYTETKAIPKGLGATHDADGVLEVLPEFESGLADIEGFSHLFLLWVFDRSHGFDLFGTPPCDDRGHGVFATRSPAGSRYQTLPVECARDHIAARLARGRGGTPEPRLSAHHILYPRHLLKPMSVRLRQVFGFRSCLSCGPKGRLVTKIRSLCRGSILLGGLRRSFVTVLESRL